MTFPITPCSSAIFESACFEETESATTALQPIELSLFHDAELAGMRKVSEQEFIKSEKKKIKDVRVLVISVTNQMQLLEFLALQGGAFDARRSKELNEIKDSLFSSKQCNEDIVARLQKRVTALSVSEQSKEQIAKMIKRVQKENTRIHDLDVRVQKVPNKSSNQSSCVIM